MPRQTAFSLVWLEQFDDNGNQIKQWCQAADDNKYAAYCKLCLKTVPCDNMGIKQLQQHAGGAKHKEIASVRFSSKQNHFAAGNADVSKFQLRALLLEPKKVRFSVCH